MTPRLLEMIDELDALKAARPDALQVPRGEGLFLYQFALSARATSVVEIGTSYGFSGLFWAAAMIQTRGHLHTIDNNPAKTASATATFAAAGVSTVVTAHTGPAADVLSALPGPIDIAFFDADRSLAVDQFKAVWPRLRPGGSIFTDNAATHRAQLQAYVAFVRDCPGASSLELPIGNGLEWTVKTS